MSQRARVLTLIAGLVVLVIAFVALRPGNDTASDEQAADPPTAQTAPSAGTASTPATDPAGTTTTATPAPKPQPKATVVRAVGLEPVGGVKKIEVHKGDTVRFTVTSDQPEHVHLHGYDVEKPVGPGQPARYSFKANIEGIFEVELEESGNQLISLEVQP